MQLKKYYCDYSSTDESTSEEVSDEKEAAERNLDADIIGSKADNSQPPLKKSKNYYSIADPSTYTQI